MSAINDAWIQLFDKYKIEDEIADRGMFRISAAQIREFKEARLMTKFDTRESLPPAFQNRYAILPVTRGDYVIGPFDLYQPFPAAAGNITQVSAGCLKDYETIRTDAVTSEAAAINLLSISGILDDFLGEEGMVQTVSGRMGSGEFSFSLRGEAPFSPYSLHVANSQIEIDGGFENRNAFCLMEAKNVVHSDFLIRQLYYPLRCWRSRIAKLIRPVFLVYSNQVFRLLEYAFEAPECYNSIRIVREKRYSFEEVRITRRDLEALCREAAANSYKPVNPDIPFVQADSFDKVVSLLDCLCQAPLSPEEIADRFSFRLRQSDYYYNACRYLGLAQKQREADGTIRVHITDKGKRIMRLPYRQRQFGLIREILRHQIFHEVFRTALETGYIPDSRLIARRLVELNAAGPGVAYRRCSSVSGWVNWILGLCNE